MQDHIIKGSCDFIKGHSSLYVTTLPSLVVIVIVVVEYNIFKSSCNLARPHGTGFFEFLEGSSS